MGTWYIPLIYVLTTNRKESTYSDVFGKLLELEPAIKPIRAMVDFELAAINAINQNFENTIVSGCFFHLTQNVWKNIQKVGLQTRYNNHVEFAVNLRMIAALAFVPENDVVKAYEAVVSTNFWLDSNANDANAEKQTLLNYFEQNYIGTMGRTQGQDRRTARFPIKLWNVFDLTITGEIQYLLVFQTVY